MSVEERVEVETVTHKARTAMIFGAIAYAILSVAFWITATPRRWVALVVAVVLALSLYGVLR